MDIVDNMLKTLDISYPARRVYLDLVRHGESPARLIAERLSMTRPSVYGHLNMLTDIGLLGEREVDGKAMFGIHDIDDLPRMLEEKMETMKKTTQAFEKERDVLKKETKTVEPKIKFFEGKEGLRRLYRDLLWESDALIETIWPHEQMADVLGEEEIRSFNRKRIRHKIKIHTIWPARTKPKRGFWKGEDWGVERRIAPPGFAWTMQYSIYGDKVAFMSSKDELFGFVVASREFASLMRTQFRALWMISG